MNILTKIQLSIILLLTKCITSIQANFINYKQNKMFPFQQKIYSGTTNAQVSEKLNLKLQRIDQQYNQQFFKSRGGKKNPIDDLKKIKRIQEEQGVAFTHRKNRNNLKKSSYQSDCDLAQTLSKSMKHNQGFLTTQEGSLTHKMQTEGDVVTSSLPSASKQMLVTYQQLTSEQTNDESQAAETDVVSADVIIHQSPNIYNQQEYVKSQMNIVNSRMDLKSGGQQDNPRISQKLENLKLLESRHRLKTQGLKLRNSYAGQVANQQTFKSSQMSNYNNFSSYQLASIQNSQSLQMAQNQDFIVKNMRQANQIEESKCFQSPKSLFQNSQFFSEQKNLKVNTFSARHFEADKSPIATPLKSSSKSPQNRSPLQAFLTSKNKSSNINVLDNKALMIQTRDKQVQQLQKEANNFQNIRTKMKERGMKSPQFCSLDLFNKVSAVKLSEKSSSMPSQEFVMKSRAQIMSQRQKIRPSLQDIQGQSPDILKIDQQQIRTEGTLSRDDLNGPNLDLYTDSHTQNQIAAPVTIQTSLSHNLDQIQESRSGNFDWTYHAKANSGNVDLFQYQQSVEDSSQDNTEQGILMSDRGRIPNFLFSDSVEQHQAERIEQMVKNFQQIQDQAKYKLTSNCFNSRDITPASPKSQPRNHPSRFDKQNSQGVSLYNVTQSGFLSSRVDNFLSPVLFSRDGRGPKKDFINSQIQYHKRHIIDKRNRNRFLKQNLDSVKQPNSQAIKNDPYETPFSELIDEEYNFDQQRAQQIYQAIQDQVKEQTTQKFTFQSFFRYLNEKRIQDELAEFQLKIFQRHNEERLSKRNVEWKEEQRKLKLESNSFKRMIGEECGKIDARITTNINKNRARANEIDGFITGFVKYLETRDKATVLKQNISKIKKVLRSQQADDIWNQTKQDQLVKIIDKFEKSDQQVTNTNSEEIKGLAINQDPKLQGDFVRFVEDLCKRDDSPLLHKQIARKTVNQLFKENMEQNRRNLMENPGQIQFIMSNQEHASSSPNTMNNKNLDLIAQETDVTIKLTKKLARMASLNTGKQIGSTLLEAIITFADLKGDQKPHLKQLAKELKNYGGINFMCDIITFNLQMKKLFHGFNIGERYKDIRDNSNFFQAPPLILLMDTTRQSQNILGQVLNVINFNLKVRTNKNASQKFFQAELESDSNSSSCMCSSHYSSDSEPSKSLAEKGRTSKMRQQKKKHQPECVYGQKMNFKLEQIDKQKINQFQAKLQTSSNALAYSNIFKNQIAKTSFYANAKTSQAFQKAKNRDDFIINEDECNRQLENGYLQNCMKDFAMPIPFFSKIVNNSLKLKKEFMSDAQAKALSQYLTSSIEPNLSEFKANMDNQIQNLHLDDCGIKDAGMSHILKAVIHQKKIESICYFNNEIGTESLNQFSHLLNFEKSGVKLFTLKLGNLSGIKSKIMRQITSDILMQENLQKLQLSHMNLEDKYIISNICKIIASIQSLYSIDLTGACLKAKSLCQIMEILIQKQKAELQKPIKFAEMNVVRQLNFSYNNITQVRRKAMEIPPKKKLTPAEEAEQAIRKDYDNLFIEKLGAYASQSKQLNHLNISGMGFEMIQDRYSLLRLFSQLANSPALQAVHISDNYLRQDPTMFPKEARFFNQILNRFGIAPQSQFDPEKKTKRDEKINICKKTIDKINMSKKVRNSEQDDKRFVDPIVFKDYYLNSLKQRVVINQKEQANYNRQTEFQLDKVVITRVIKNELSCINHGKDLNWKLSRGNECFMCDRHKYTLIFIDKKRQNDGFIKITDPESINNLKKVCRLNRCEHSLPQIFGTVTGDWTEQVTCLDAHLYSLVNLVDQPKFLQAIQAPSEISKDIIQGVKQIVHSPLVNLSSLFSLHNYLTEYQIPLHDLVINNDHTDIHAINIPQSVVTLSDQMMKFDKRRVQDSSQVPYVFYGVLPPGYHQFLVYIPSQDTFWFKDFVLDANKKDWFPEWPDTFSYPNQEKIVTDVWQDPQSQFPQNYVASDTNDEDKPNQIDGQELPSYQRQQMRENKTLLRLLSDNRDGIHFIYQKTLKDGLFTVESALTFIEQVFSSIQQETVHKLFTECKISSTTSLQMDHLEEVEFFELICRLSLAEGQSNLSQLNFSLPQTAHAVHNTLKKLFQHFEAEVNMGLKLCQVIENHDDQKFISAVDKYMLEGNNDFIIGLQILRQKGHQGHHHAPAYEEGHGHHHAHGHGHEEPKIQNADGHSHGH